MPTFSPVSSLSSNGLRMRVCVRVRVYSTGKVRNELICGYVNVVHTSSSFRPHTHTHTYTHTNTHTQCIHTHTQTHTHSHTIWGPQTDRAKIGHCPHLLDTVNECDWMSRVVVNSSWLQFTQLMLWHWGVLRKNKNLKNQQHNNKPRKKATQQHLSTANAITLKNSEKQSITSASQCFTFHLTTVFWGVFFFFLFFFFTVMFNCFLNSACEHIYTEIRKVF